MVTLFLAIISFALVARTGYLGGQIRHTETSSSTNVQNGNEKNNEQGEKQDNDDDD